MSSRGPRRLSRLLLGLLLVAPMGLVGWWLWARPTDAVSSFDEALDSALGPVMEQREVRLKLGAASPRQARLLARNLAETSIPYLAPRDLELWQATRLRVAQASLVDCARLWKGGSPDFLGPAIAALGDEAVTAYTEMLARGLALRLERKPPPEPPPGSLERGFAGVAALVPAAEREAFEADLRRPDVSDARACQLFIAVSTNAEKLEQKSRTDFLRALAKNLKSP